VLGIDGLLLYNSKKNSQKEYILIYLLSTISYLEGSVCAILKGVKPNTMFC